VLTGYDAEPRYFHPRTFNAGDGSWSLSPSPTAGLKASFNLRVRTTKRPPRRAGGRPRDFKGAYRTPAEDRCLLLLGLANRDAQMREDQHMSQQQNLGTSLLEQRKRAKTRIEFSLRKQPNLKSRPWTAATSTALWSSKSHADCDNTSGFFPTLG